jgi:hypothetical protein
MSRSFMFLLAPALLFGISLGVRHHPETSGRHNR